MTLTLVLSFAVDVASAGEKQATEQASIDQYVGMDVGEVTRARGNIASVFQSLPRTLGAGSDVKFLDTILTGENTRAEITLIDDSLLSLGDHSELPSTKWSTRLARVRTPRPFLPGS